MANNFAGSAAQIGTAAATGNYVSAGLGLLGLGISAFAGSKQADDAARLASLSKEEIGYESQIQDQKRTAMQLSARRQQLEIMRNTQRARAQGLQAGVTQGAQYGSGVAGGQAQEQAMGFYNLKGVDQNLAIGENIFGLNRKISGVKMQMTDVQSQMSTDAGIGAIGAGISKSADAGGRLSGQLFATNYDNTSFGSSSNYAGQSPNDFIG